MKLINGKTPTKIGQGTWYMGELPDKREEEIRALRCGFENGMNLIDTAEMYGEGAAEQLVGKVLPFFRREDVFLVSKVYPHNAGGKRLVQSCEASLKRMGTDVIDLYLLHWRGRIPLAETIEGMRKLQSEGKIRYWGVSNFDTDDMRELLRAGGQDCRTNQVLYHLGSRGIEYDLLPWMKDHQMTTMAYCPLAEAGALRRGIVEHPSVLKLAHEHGWSPFQVLLAFASYSEEIIAIPKAGKPEHAEENAAMLKEKLSAEEFALLNEAFPPPKKKMPLDIV